MSGTASSRDPRGATSPRVLPRVLGWVLAVVAALGVFIAYLDPSLMVALGNAVWSCL